VSADSDQPASFRKSLLLLVAAIPILSLLAYLWPARKPLPKEPEVSHAPAPSEKPLPSPALARATVLKQKVYNFDVELEADDEALARTAMAAMATSELWKFYFDEEYAFSGKRVPFPAVQARVSCSADGASVTGRFEIVKPEAVTVEKTWNAPVTAGVPPDLAVVADEAALDLFFRAHHPRPSRLVQAERRLLDIFDKTPEGLRKDSIRQRLRVLGESGSFDAAYAALDLAKARTRAAELVAVEGKDYLVKQVREQLASEPIWALYFSVRAEPLRIAIESSVKIHDPTKGPGHVIVQGYSPGTATVKISIRDGNDKPVYDGTTANGTPSTVKAGTDPHKRAEEDGVWLHMLEVAAKFTKELPLALRQEHFLLLVAQMGRVEYAQKHHELFEALCVETALDSAVCQDVLVNGLGSRLERMGDRCLRVLHRTGQQSVGALVRGLSHPSSLVRGWSTTGLRSFGQEWYLPQVQEIVRRAVQSLAESEHRETHAQTAYLLQRLGPLASAALPALAAMEESRRPFDKEAARKAIEAIKKQ
jgi:hypothetical protein